MDDFGTGYSSLLEHKKLSADCVKLDRSFIETLTHPGRLRDHMCGIDLLRCLIFQSLRKDLKHKAMSKPYAR
ncbi:hypothetical protein OH492_17480 [Vibrio chagasii]|nr:hypothetical protein [Vibrio chagasii]